MSVFVGLKGMNRISIEVMSIYISVSSGEIEKARWQL
jgi:hypothetical protein